MHFCILFTAAKTFGIWEEAYCLNQTIKTASVWQHFLQNIFKVFSSVQNPSSCLDFFHGLHSGQDFNTPLNCRFVPELSASPVQSFCKWAQKMTLRRGWLDVNQSLPKSLAEAKGLLAH